MLAWVIIAQTNTSKAQGALPTDKFLGQIQHESWPNDAGTSNIVQCVPDTQWQASYIYTPDKLHTLSTYDTKLHTRICLKYAYYHNSDDNNDRLSWQKSVEEARKEQVRKPSEYQHSKRISSKESLNLCDTQKPRRILNTKVRSQHHYRYLSLESQTCSG
jgi:hypothetical protein